MTISRRRALRLMGFVRPAESDWHKRYRIEMRLRDAVHQRSCDEQREQYEFDSKRNPERLAAPAAVAYLRGCVALD